MQFKVQNNAAQCNAVLLQCNTCSRLKTSVNSVHLGPGGHFFQGGAQAARLKGCKDSGTCRGLCRMQEGECVFCREASSAGGRGIVCVICRGVRLQGCGHRAPRCRERAGDSSRTCCCPENAKFDNFSLLFGLFTQYQILLKKYNGFIWI